MKAFQQEKAAKEKADRGKWAEGQVQDYLTKLGNASANFDWNRQYDARSAGGRFPSQPGDFQFFAKLPASLQGDEPWTVNGLIEVKEVASGTRLPQKNFEKAKINRLRKRMLAGARIYVVVWMEDEQLWVRPPFSMFAKEPAAKSWDLAGQGYVSLKELFAWEEALRYYGKD